MSKKDDFKDAAKAMAKKSKFRQRLGAVVVKGGKIVGRGYNYSHSTGKALSDGMHAEVSALNNTTAKFRDGSVIYVYRIKGNDNSSGLAKPCGRCEAVMIKMGVKYVHFSTDEGWDRILL